MHIYFSGINGVGLGPLAQIAKDMGHSVSGSDITNSSLNWPFEQLGINVYDNTSESDIKKVHSSNPIDWFVYTSALKPDHPELLFAKNQKIKTSKRDELLNQLITDAKLKLVAVGGTHGKTTTTAMLVWAMKQLGIPVSYSIGTKINFGPSGRFDPKSKFFIYEADEFDRNFLNFSPYLSIITSLDYDHPDTYSTKKEYLEAFEQFILNSNQVHIWQKDYNLLRNKQLNTKVATHSLKQQFNQIKLLGEHNRHNAYLAIQTIKELTQSNEESIVDAINKFPGTSRRFERISNNIYSDYAHHPTEIKATINLAREINKNVIVVYQPHQNIRQHQIKNSYKQVFDNVKQLYWLPTYLSREDPKLRVLKPEELVKYVESNKVPVKLARMNEELKQELLDYAKKNNLVVLMSAGDLDTWAKKELV